MVLNDFSFKTILDSRGEETVLAEVMAEEDVSASASVPSGKSKGSYETVSLPIAKKDEIKAILSKNVLGKDFSSQREFDQLLIDLDGTEKKEALGGNFVLALSLAFARANAKFQKTNLFSYIKWVLKNDLVFEAESKIPHPIFNVINGGAHAKNKLNFQEFQVIPSTSEYAIGLAVGQEFYRKLGEILKDKFGEENISLGDEAGYSCDFSDDREALEIIYELINKNKYPLKIGLDCAASHFYKDGVYHLGDNKFNTGNLLDYYQKIKESYDIISIEDPFAEDDFDGFSDMTAKIKDLMVVADDLTVTNISRLKKAIEAGAGNCVLIKPNQVGTLYETLEAVRDAYVSGWKVVVSHRSGETEDDFIADLAVGVGAWGIKSGSPATKERMSKYQRILDIINSQTI